MSLISYILFYNYDRKIKKEQVIAFNELENMVYGERFNLSAESD